MLLSRVSLAALRTFAEVAHQRSLSKAAERLCISPSAVSHQMKLLEQQLETPLLERRARGVELTDAGQRLASHACQAIHQLEQGLQQAIEIPRQQLHIAAIPALLQLWLIPRLESFYAEHPQINLILTDQDQLSDFGRTDIDLHLHFGSGDFAGLHSELLMTESLVPVCSPQLRQRYPSAEALLTSAAVRRLSYSAGEEDQPGGLNWQGWFNRAGLTMNNQQSESRFNHLAPLYSAAEYGQGIAPGWKQLIQPQLESGSLICLSEIDVALRFSYYAVAPEAHFERPAVKQFMAWLRSAVATVASGPEPSERMLSPLTPSAPSAV